MPSKADIVARWDAGASQAKIAEEFGISRQRVHQLLRGQRKGPNRNALPTKERLLDAAKESTTLHALAHSLKLSDGRLDLALEHRGVREAVAELIVAARKRSAEQRNLEDRKPLVERIRKVAAKVGHTPDQVELQADGIFHVTLARKFGSVPSAMAAAGLVPNVKGHEPFPLPAGFAHETQPVDDEKELYRRASVLQSLGVDEVPVGNATPSQAESKTKRYVRDPAVVAWVLSTAAGHCELCGEPGYETDDGTAFLEVHHVVPLGEKGADAVSNAVGICELCHGKLHRWVGRHALLDTLYARVPRLVRPARDAAAV